MRGFLLLMVAALGLGACSQPLTELKPPTFQDKATNAEHRQRMANKNVTRAVKALSDVPDLDVRVHALSDEGLPTPTLNGY